MTPTSDASASLRLALQKLGRARRAFLNDDDLTMVTELALAENAIKDAQSLLTPDDTPEAV